MFQNCTNRKSRTWPDLGGWYQATITLSLHLCNFCILNWNPMLVYISMISMTIERSSKCESLSLHWSYLGWSRQPVAIKRWARNNGLGSQKRSMMPVVNLIPNRKEKKVFIVNQSFIMSAVSEIEAGGQNWYSPHFLESWARHGGGVVVLVSS